MRHFVYLIPSVLLLGSCATTESSLQPWQGDSFRTGSGGVAETIEGVEIWRHGTPPRRYQILGIIEDERDAHPFSTRSTDYDIAEQVKAAGGDAAIFLSKDAGLGFQRGFSLGGHTGVLVKTAVQVVKYLR